MATTKDYVDFVCEMIKASGVVTSKKMFGEYMIYLNDKPLLLLCDNVVYIKMKDEIKGLMEDADTGYPYNGAKLHYILDVEDEDLTRRVLPILESITEIPKPKKKRMGSSL